MKKTLLRFCQESARLEELIPAYLEKLEEKKSVLEEKIDDYDFKPALSNRQEERRDEWEDKVSEIDDEIELLENVRTSIQDINLELIEYLDKNNVAPSDNSLLFSDELEEKDELDALPQQPSTFGTAIKAAIATELTMDAFKNSDK